MLNVLTATGTRNFADETRLFDRSVDSTNFLLDNWWVWALCIVAIVIFWLALSAMRSVGALDARCKSAFADIDAILSERNALIPNLVEVTKAQSKQDFEVLDRLLDAQQNALKAMGGHRLRAETEVGNALNQFVNVAGSIPELSSSGAFITLRGELTRIEEKVTAARRYYNMTVEEYEAVLGGMVAGSMARLSGLSHHPRFDLGEEREELSRPQRVAFS